MTNQTGSCAGVYGRPECVSSTWFAHVTFSDTGEGLLSITSRENRNGTFTGKENQVRATGIGEQNIRIFRLLASDYSCFFFSNIEEATPGTAFRPLFFSTARRLFVVFRFPILTISFAAFESLFIISSLCDKEFYVVINKIDSEKIFRLASVNIPIHLFLYFFQSQLSAKVRSTHLFQRHFNLTVAIQKLFSLVSTS